MSAHPVSHRVLMISNKDLFIDLVSVFLEGWFHPEIEVADSSRKVEQFFVDGAPKGVALLLVEDEKILSSAGRNVADFMAPTIVVGKQPKEKVLSGRRLEYIASPVNLDQLEELIRSFAQSAGRPAREYCPVRLGVLLLSGKELKQDVFLQAKGGPGGYELAFRKGEALKLSPELLRKLGGNQVLYLRSGDLAGFMRGFAEEVQGLSTSTQIFDLSQSMKVTSSVHEMLATTIPELGFTPELQQAAKASIDLAVSSLKNDSKLSELLANLSKNESSYLSWHSIALCHITCRLSNLMTWDSANTHYKLSLASFLHDITVAHPKFERVSSLAALELVPGEELEKQRFLEHAHVAAGMAREMKDFPGDVDHIIAQHHEMPDGSGFPLGLNHTKISPLAALFIVAHEITDELFDKKVAFNLADCVARLERTYVQGYFRRVISAVKELASKGASAL